MFKFERMYKLYESGVIAILRGLTEGELHEVIPRLAENGITTVEITLDTPDALHVIESSVRLFADRAQIGAGTVLDAASARQAISVGAEYVISPTLNPGVIETALRFGKPVIPGIMTPTEALRALELGADAVKIFPADTLGLPFVKALRGPLSQIPLVPTGGVDERNAGSFISAGAIAVGVASALADVQLARSGMWAEIERRARAFRAAVNSVRGN